MSLKHENEWYLLIISYTVLPQKGYIFDEYSSGEEVHVSITKSHSDLQFLVPASKHTQLDIYSRVKG